MHKPQRDPGVETTTYKGEPIRVGLLKLCAKGGELTGSREDGKPVRFVRKGGAIYVTGDGKLDAGAA